MKNVLLIDRNPIMWTFTLNRPDKRNALSSDLVEALIKGLDEASAAGVPQLMFCGVGKNFSAGFDFTNYKDQTEGDLAVRMIRIEEMLQKVAYWPGPTVAFAHGRNFGAGVDLFAACKRRYCTSDTHFRMPGLMFGLVLGTGRFRTIVGLAHAHSILSTARMFDAEEAARIGFIECIVPESKWADLIEDSVRSANLLEPETRASLYEILADKDGDADMAALVRSATRPGLKARIARYLGDD